jgi:hypothetical protein
MSSQKLFDLLPAVYRLRDTQLAQSQNLLSASDAAQIRANTVKPTHGQGHARSAPIVADAD